MQNNVSSAALRVNSRWSRETQQWQIVTSVWHPSYTSTQMSTSFFSLVGNRTSTKMTWLQHAAKPSYAYKTVEQAIQCIENFQVAPGSLCHLPKPIIFCLCIFDYFWHTTCSTTHVPASWVMRNVALLCFHTRWQAKSLPLSHSLSCCLSFCISSASDLYYVCGSFTSSFQCTHRI